MTVAMDRLVLDMVAGYNALIAALVESQEGQGQTFAPEPQEGDGTGEEAPESDGQEEPAVEPPSDICFRSARSFSA